MASSKLTHQIGFGEETRRLTLTDSFAAPGATDWLRVWGDLAVQITGEADSFTAQVERSAVDPDAEDGADPSPVGEAMSGDPATVEPAGFYEPGAAWWRVTVSDVQGGDIRVAISGAGW